MLSHAPACGKIPPRARASIRLAGEIWTRFLAIWDALAAIESDQLIEDFGPFYATFRALQRCGVPFSDEFIESVQRAYRTCLSRDDDPDEDNSDQWLDLDDSDNDGLSDSLEGGHGSS
jgi:hypothetical protein